MSQSDTTASVGYATKQELHAFEDAIAKRISTLESEVSELRTITCGAPEQDLKTLTRDQQVNRLRTYLFDKAKDTRNGRYAAQWKEVRGYFNGAFSDGHYYNLMSAAGNADGYVYDESPNGNKRISVDLSEISAD